MPSRLLHTVVNTEYRTQVPSIDGAPGLLFTDSVPVGEAVYVYEEETDMTREVKEVPVIYRRIPSKFIEKDVLLDGTCLQLPRFTMDHEGFGDWLIDALAEHLGSREAGLKALKEFIEYGAKEL